MKESLWGYYLVLLGITVSTVMILVTNMTTTNQQDYYLLKEITNAAMIDSIDYTYYTLYGKPKINTEKFVENFIRRFSESISKTNTYRIEFYSIYENPPSVSIKVSSNTGDFHIEGNETNIDVINSIDAILEANNVITGSEVFYSLPYAVCNKEKTVFLDDDNYCQFAVRSQFNLNDNSLIFNNVAKVLENRKEKIILDKSKIKISDVEFLSLMTTQVDIDTRNKQYNISWNRKYEEGDIPFDNLKEDYLSKNVKNIKIGIKEDNSGNYYLGLGFNYNCDGASTFNASGKKWDGACLIGIKYRVNFYYDES